MLVCLARLLLDLVFCGPFIIIILRSLLLLSSRLLPHSGEINAGKGKNNQILSAGVCFDFALKKKFPVSALPSFAARQDSMAEMRKEDLMMSLAFRCSGSLHTITALMGVL